MSLDALPWQVPTTAYTENMASLVGKTAETYPVTVLWPEFQLEACLGEEFIPPLLSPNFPLLGLWLHRSGLHLRLLLVAFFP